MGATERLKIILEAQTKGFNSIRSARGDLDELDKSATKAKGGFANMLPGLAAVGVAFGGMAVAARGAWSALEGGAALIDTRVKFDRLAESIGTTGDALRTDLDDGIGLLLSKSEQMKAATDLMGLGLAKTSEEATRLAIVAAQLDMGLDQLALTLSNKTTMRFDQMNMRVDGFAEKVAKLEAAGKSADEAFKWAFIQQAEAQVKLIGEKSTTAMGDIEKLKNMWENTKESFLASFANAAISQMDGIGNAAERNTPKIYALADAWGAFLGGIPGALQGGLFGGAARAGQAQREKNINAPLMAKIAGMLDPSVGYRIQGNQVGGTSTTPTNKYTTADLSYIPASAHGNKAIAEAFNANEKFNIGLRNQIDAQLKLEEQTKDTASAFGRGAGGFTSSIDEAAQAMANLSAESGDIFQRLRGQDEFNLAEEIFKMGGQSAHGMAGFGVASGLFDQARANELMNQTFLLQSAQQLLASGIGGADLWNAIQGMQGQLGEGSTLAQDFFSNLDASVQPSIETDQMTTEMEAWAVNMSETLVIEPKVVIPMQAVEDAVAESFEDPR